MKSHYISIVLAAIMVVQIAGLIGLLKIVDQSIKDMAIDFTEMMNSKNFSYTKTDTAIQKKLKSTLLYNRTGYMAVTLFSLFNLIAIAYITWASN